MRLHVTDRGRGEAVVFLHGSVPDPPAFDPIADVLVASRRVLCPWVPGHGASTWTGPFTLDELADAITADLRELGVTRCALVGYSFGGWLALALASAGDLDVTRVVTLGGFASHEPAGRERLRGFAQAIRAGIDVTGPGALSFYSPSFAAAHPEVVERTRLALAGFSPEAVAAECDAAADAPDLRPRLGAIRAPVVVRVGELDGATPPSRSEEIVRLVPHGTLQVVKGAGHALLDEDLEGTTRAIVEALG